MYLDDLLHFYFPENVQYKKGALYETEEKIMHNGS